MTRNSYGAEVLNASRVVFIDVDVEQKVEKKGFFNSLFSKPAPSKEVEAEEPYIASLKDWQKRNSEYGFRIYKTAGGLRYLMTSHLSEPGSSLTKELFEICKADEKYAQLCIVQKSFRARLTPKPWRSGLEKPEVRYPFESQKESDSINNWVKEYNSLIANYSTCHLIESIGPEISEIQQVVNIHDRRSGVEKRLQLA